MDQVPSRTGNNDDYNASLGGASSLNFTFLDEEVEAETVVETTEPVEDRSSTLEVSSAFIKANHKMPASSSSGKLETATKKLLTESPAEGK